ncbi:MAG TPA: IS481 family transposase [Methylomirabilota bacterium]|jgi:transposase InsO family protein
MNIHKNARLTLSRRVELVRRVEQGVPLTQAARAAGISVRTGRKWLARYRAEGLAGLPDRSSRPHGSPRATPAAVQLGIKALRAQRWTCQQIAGAVGVSATTTARILRRSGLSRRGRLEPPRLVHRYEHAHVGDLLHLDTKKLGRIQGVGHRITGQRRSTPRGIDWEFLHVAIDDHSRVAYLELLADERRETVAGFLRQALRWFRARGVRVRRILTDNGSGYVSRSFRATCRALHVHHQRTRPYTPRTNGKAERFIQTALREWAYRRPYYTSADRQRMLPGWLEHYNCARPHGSLGGQPPMSRFPGGNNLMLVHS